MAGAWNPWRALRDRPHLILHHHELGRLGGGAIYVPRGPVAVILMDPELGRVERRCVLAHELVHDERGGILDDPDTPPAMAVFAQREEARVTRIVVDRLVPLGELAALVDQVVDDGGQVTPAIVAEAFDVTEDVALDALVRLQLERRAVTVRE